MRHRPTLQQPDVLSRDGPNFALNSMKQKRRFRRLHGHMKHETGRLFTATIRTGMMVGFALLLILVLLPAAIAQAAGPR